MAVVPFVLNGPGRSVCTALEEYDKEKPLVFIRNVDMEQLNDRKSSNVCYDLRVGPKYRDHRTSRQIDLVEPEDHITLSRGAAVIITTEEEVKFPRSRFGEIFPRVTLMQRGIANTTSKVDPGFEGRLLITVYNLGARQEELKRGDPFCALVIHEVTDSPTLRDKSAPDQKGERPRRGWELVKEWFDRNAGLLTALYFLLMVLGAALAVAQYFWRILWVPH